MKTKYRKLAIVLFCFGALVFLPAGLCGDECNGSSPCIPDVAQQS